MATLAIPVGSQPFLKTSERPISRQAGAAIAVMDPIYLKSSDSKYYTADSDPTDAETSVVVGIALSKSETDAYVHYVSTTGTVIDFGGTLTVGDTYWLNGSVIDNSYAAVSSLDYLVRLGYANEDGDFVVNIINQGEVK
jgi:hypothetical protein